MLNMYDLSAKHPLAAAGYSVLSTGIVHPTRFINEHLFIYMLDGRWEFWMDDERFEAKKGDVFIYQANRLEHGKLPCADGTQTVYFHVRAADTDGFVASVPETPDPGRIFLPSLIRIPNDDELLSYFKKMVLLENFPTSTFDIEATALFNLVVCHLNDHVLRNGLSTDIADSVLSTIYTHPDKFYSLDELAEEFFVSRRTLSRLFKERTGMGVHAYQLDKKLETAARLLCERDNRSLSEIATALGFYDEFHFSKQFKSKYGCSPSTYRSKC